MAHRILSDSLDVENFFRFIGTLKLPVTVEWTQGRDRTKEQNHLQFLWAREVADQLGDQTITEVRCEWKLRYGVPIMRADSPEFREAYDLTIKPQSYENKLKLMEFFPVTSLMKVRQMVQYLDTVQRECVKNGLQLTDPSDDLSKYHARYRDNAA